MIFKCLFLNHLFQNSIEQDLSKTALKNKRTTLSYSELIDSINLTSMWLKNKGVLKNKVVAIDNSIDPVKFIVAFLSVLEAGCTPCVIIDKKLLKENNLLHYELNCSKENGTKSDTICDYFNLVIHFPSEYADIRNNEVLLTSSGTTSAPKIIKQSLQSIINNIKANVNALSINSQQITLSILPVNYSYGLIAQVFSHLYSNATIVFENLNYFFLNSFKSVIGNNITNIFMVPSIIRQLLIYEQRNNIKPQYSQLQFITAGGSFLDSYTLMASLNYFGCKIIQTYGLTEAGPRVTTNVIDSIDAVKKNCVGRPLENTTIQIINEKGEVEKDEIIGKILVNSNSVCLGYYNLNPQLVGILPGKKILTKDIGYMKNGELYVLGREGNYIVHSGMKIWYSEIEEILYKTGSFYKTTIQQSMGKTYISLFPVANCHLTEKDIYKMLNDKLGEKIQENLIEIKLSKLSNNWSFK